MDGIVVAGVLVDQVLQRVRDPQGVPATRDFVRRRLSDAQRLINARFGFLLDSTTLTTEPLRIFYPLRALLPEATKIRFIKQESRNLVYTSWQTMFGMKRGWPRIVRDKFVIWSPIGRDLIIVWPANPRSITLTVESARNTAELQNDGSEFELVDDVLPMVVDLATVLVLMKERDFAPVAEVMSSLVGRMKERTLAP